MAVKYLAVILSIVFLCGCLVNPSFTELDRAGNEGMICFPMAGVGGVPPPPDNSSGSSGSVGAVMANKEKKECLFFTAKWCGPCHVFKRDQIPQLEKWGWSYDKKDKNHNIQPIDFDEAENKALVEKYSISQLPTFVLVIDGKEVRRIVGTMPAMEFVKFYNGK